MTAVRSTGDDDQPDSHDKRFPASICSDAACEPSLVVERPKKLVDVHDVGLQLDDEDRSSAWMPREQVDHAALTIDREGRFRDEVPGGPTSAERAHDGLVELGVATVEQPVEIAATPTGTTSTRMSSAAAIVRTRPMDKVVMWPRSTLETVA